jgi:nucleoside-diphosphate-sugar epimerase
MRRLLIVGFGDIALRALPELCIHFPVTAVVRPPRLAQVSPRPGVQIVPADHDVPQSRESIAAEATHVLHCAPPPASGSHDVRTAHLLVALASAARLERIVYISTSGVYGNCDGAWVNEDRPVNPGTERARRRVDAESRLQTWGAERGVRVIILRAPGIYAAERLPLQRLRNRTPVLRAEDDGYTNHIHADDLARIAVCALTHPVARGIYNAADDTELRMGEWFDLLADRAGLPRPPRIARADAAAHIPAPLLSFMAESRRLCNERMKRELGVQLRYPTVIEGLPRTITS